MYEWLLHWSPVFIVVSVMLMCVVMVLMLILALRGIRMLREQAATIADQRGIIEVQLARLTELETERRERLS